MAHKKTLCEWEKKEIEKNFQELSSLIGKPKFICNKCARSSKFEYNLCKPLKIKKKDCISD